MDEGRRFLRYVIPGTVFIVEAWVLMWLLLPGPAVDLLKSTAASGTEAIAVIVAAATAFGVILSALHHQLSWFFGSRSGAWAKGRLARFAPPDFGPMLARLKEYGFPEESKDEPKLPPCLQAWAFQTAIWHERVDSEGPVKAANRRTDSLGDLMHSMGTGRVAATLAPLVALTVARPYAVSDFALEPAVRLGVMLVAAVVVWCAFDGGYTRNRELLTSIVEYVLRHAPTFPRPPTTRPTVE